MPEGRMLKKVVSTSRKLAQLNSNGACLLYTWLLPHLDIEGRFFGDPEVLKGQIFPRISRITPGVVQEYLDDLVKNELIILYSANGDTFLEFTKFKDFQILRPDREAPSYIPIPPTPGELRENAGRTPAKVKESKVKESKVRVSGKKTARHSKPNPDVKKFIDWWFEKFKDIFKVKYSVTSKDGALVKRLLSSSTYDELEGLARQFFESEDDFIKNAGYTIGVFSSQVNKLKSKEEDIFDPEQQKQFDQQRKEREAKHGRIDPNFERSTF